MLGLSYTIRLSPRIEKQLATLFTPSPSRVGHPGDPYTRHTANITFAVCLTIAVCCICWLTAKDRFAVCPCFGTRQTFRHTAIRGFPVVEGGERNEVVRAEVTCINVSGSCLVGQARGFTDFQLKPRYGQFNGSNLNTKHLLGLSLYLALKMNGGKLKDSWTTMKHTTR